MDGLGTRAGAAADADFSQRVCAYLRKSRKDRDTDWDGNKLSDEDILARQQQLCDDLASRNGLVIAHYYRDVKSGETLAVRPYAGEDTLEGRMGWLTRKTARELAASYLDTYLQAFPGKPGSLLESIQGQLRSLVESKDMLSFCTYCGRPISPSSIPQTHDSYACKYALYRRKGDMVAALESYGVAGEKAADDLLYRRAPTR